MMNCQKNTKFGKKLKIVSKNSESVCKETYLKAKIKFYYGKINTNFHNDTLSKEGSQFNCLSVILIDSVFRTGKN